MLLFGGKIVVINLPVAKYREAGQYAALIRARLFQRAVDRRAYTPPVTRPVFLWEDEAHYFTVDQDALFQTTARSKGISTVRLSQDLPNLTRLSKLTLELGITFRCSQDPYSAPDPRASFLPVLATPGRRWSH